MPVVYPPRPEAPLAALIRPAVWAIALALAAALCACGNDDDHRDQSYGTDVGEGYQLPDGSLDRTPETGGIDAGDTGLDAAPDEDGADGGSANAAAFQDAGEAADTGTGG